MREMYLKKHNFIFSNEFVVNGLIFFVLSTSFLGAAYAKKN